MRRGWGFLIAEWSPQSKIRGNPGKRGNSETLRSPRNRNAERFLATGCVFTQQMATFKSPFRLLICSVFSQAHLLILILVHIHIHVHIPGHRCTAGSSHNIALAHISWVWMVGRRSGDLDDLGSHRGSTFAVWSWLNWCWQRMKGSGWESATETTARTAKPWAQWLKNDLVVTYLS